MLYAYNKLLSITFFSQQRSKKRSIHHQNICIINEQIYTQRKKGWGQIHQIFTKIQNWPKVILIVFSHRIILTVQRCCVALAQIWDCIAPSLSPHKSLFSDSLCNTLSQRSLHGRLSLVPGLQYWPLIGRWGLGPRHYAIQSPTTLNIWSQTPLLQS